MGFNQVYLKAGRILKVFVRVLILLILVLLVFYYTDNRVKENKPLQSPVKQGTAVPAPEKGIGAAIPQTSRPEKGLSTLIGEQSAVLTEEMGEPDRVEPSGYGYDWWIYSNNHNLMIGVTEDGLINQVFTADFTSDITPFEIGQEINDIYRFTIVGSEIDVAIDDNVYTFSLNSEDMKTRLLIIYQGLYAQLYIDGLDGELVAVRFIDPETLVLHQPYDMAYMGELLVSEPRSSTFQQEVDRTIERQIFELTNVYRERHGLPTLQEDSSLTVLAQEHSKEMALENYLSNESPVSGSLAERLKSAMVEQRKAGENIASDYVDAIEAVHGWLNSSAHRNVLLDADFTHLGTGAYGNYYAQILIRKTETGEEVDPPTENDINPEKE